MIILVIEGTYPWYRGGVSEWVSQYLGAFEDTEFALLQIATDPFRNASIQDALYEVPSHVTHFLRFPPPIIDIDWEQDMKDWAAESVRRIDRRIIDNASCVHVANTGFAGWLGMALAQQYDTPLLLTEHALYWKEVDMGAVALECGYEISEAHGGKKFISHLFRKTAQKVYQASDLIISVSECNMADQRLLGARDIAYIPNGVEASWLLDEKPWSGMLTLGWIGRCAEMKNPLKFIALARELGERARCVMMLSDAGEKQLAQKVCTLAKTIPNLTLIWDQPARAHIDTMDALCITSHNESQPLVLFEALSRRILPVGWRVGDVTEKYAVTFDDACPIPVFADAVLQLWADKKQWREKVDHCHRRVKEKHTWRIIFESYRKELSSCLTSSARPS
ncbi:DUF3492 domain-containing protein [Fodinibius sediminis]|uniref:Glycosyltransferase involved in cell wall bisynthesis n=1 Tax=Fodinibius sediminis TaxID=1214077 RepID=A0A521CLR9_9BACT|nr:DUF3492 domain-containing protein [Fodinibius sediminis]SMO60399.1 Glycosyltransferase involved in cell wall bisynthesis [Fodinibius sediminis]